MARNKTASRQRRTSAKATKSKVTLQALAAWAVLAFVASLLVTSLIPQEEAKTATVATVRMPEDPYHLSAEDKDLYTLIFTAQEARDFARADQLMSSLTNDGLLGYVLAERYLADKYPASAEELQQWLENYSDHPQAKRIAALAVQRGMKARLPETTPLLGDGYSDHLGRSTMPDLWFTALNYWREGSYDQARTQFEKLANDSSLNPWHRAAANYWAYRANESLGDHRAATRALARAAQYPTTFYGLLAARANGSLHLNAEAPAVSHEVRRNPAAVRAFLLSDLGRTEEAETELRILYGNSAVEDRAGIVTLAGEMGLSNLQMRLAKLDSLTSEEALYASYPTPAHMQSLNPIMDAALLMAIARNESGFRDLARSESGAAGMMQMLPSTARMIERHIKTQGVETASLDSNLGSVAERLTDPELSARYGAEYLRMLSRQPAINHNLVHLLVGYNAGTGTVISWKAAGRHINDPLLYIESIPYPETRNYVMQVMAQYWIYQTLLDKNSRSLDAMAHGQWPRV